MVDSKNIRKIIYAIIIPIIFESILQVGAGVVSAAMIGRLTPLDISAQGISFRITDLLWVFYRGISIGATIFIAKYYGAKRFDECRSVFQNSVVVTVMLSVMFQFILFFRAEMLFKFFTDDLLVIENAVGYIKIMLIGFPFVVVMSFVTAAFQGHGNTKVPMYIAAIMNVVSISTGYVLIFGKFGAPNLGLRGAAMALVSSQIIGASIGLHCLYNKKSGLFATTTRKSFRFDFDKIKNVYLVGVPAALESIFWQLSAILMSKIILTYGGASFAAYQLGIQAESITEMPAIGFGVAAMSLTSMAIGKKDQILFNQYFKELMKISGVISVITSLSLILFPWVFMSILTNNVELQRIGVLYVIVMGFIQIPQNLSRTVNGTIRAVGYKNVPMCISGFGIWIFRIPLAMLIAYVLKWDIIFIWMCIAADQVVRFTLSMTFFKVKKIETTVLDIDRVKRAKVESK